ncbi:hypothetical protein Athai_06010 [Actinocatenispora thailandica]|uniref:DinB-like domain-containing protein n=1 Tax=Actinocatenispora thailandica TaxID=227318 RepID=A0A7R7HVD3_9ACTN|nr:hypothetical protein [Actinocatenispora thailandica]BCJ33098.1 hypothetical protein Athai_06010 [Actinocatenispora thailandica]
MDTDTLRQAYDALLDAAASLAGQPTAPPAGEWDTDEILAHVALVDAGTLAAGYAVAAGAHAGYDNRIAQDRWTIRRTIHRAGGNTGLRDRIRRQGDALCTLAGQLLGPDELNTAIPTLLVSGDAVLVDQPVPLRDIVAGLAADHLPRHAAQLIALRSPRRPAADQLPADGRGGRPLPAAR